MLRLHNSFDVLLKYSQWLNIAQRVEGVSFLLKTDIEKSGTQ